jgi:hypothetical protein
LKKQEKKKFSNPQKFIKKPFQITKEKKQESNIYLRSIENENQK